jgi:hypothetical protein
MSSELIVDELTGRASAGSIAVTAEGGTVTTNLQQGLAKAWVNLDGTGTIVISDSYNVGSLIDIGVGQYEVVFTNAMSNANYSATSSNDGWGAGGTYNVSTAKFRCVARTYTWDVADVDVMMGQVCGDLA